MRYTILLAMLLTCFCNGAEVPALELASPFVKDMILQREMPVPVWGWAAPGQAVTVDFAGQHKQASADQKGKWRLQLDNLAASAEERVFTVSAGAESIQLTGVLVGEVWFASGQSNMDWLASKSMCGQLAGEMQRNEVPVREYAVDTGSAIFPCSRAASEDGWKRSTKAGSFSALSLAFAAQLYQELKVPIGLIRCTHGATTVETWTPYEGFADHPLLQDIARGIREINPTTEDSAKAYDAYFTALKGWQLEGEALVNRGGQPPKRPDLPGIADDWKGASRMYNKKVAPLVPYAVRGTIWCQGTHNAGDGRIYAAKMEALVNGLRKTWNRPDMPFYFTQMQSYGAPDPDNVGFADIREAQTLFFMNARNVGMVPQYDLNPATPGAIHYYNKLDPGKRLARWALAHEYGRTEMAYCGPIYKSHRIDGSKVIVQFEQRGPGGGLMVASKGMEADMKADPNAYVEPARATPALPLQHFRLAGRDRIWRAAKAEIVGSEVVVQCPEVPHPIGVQYAYSAVPIGANLYNEAGLPALPFAYFDGRQMFNEDDPAAVAKAQAATEPQAQVNNYLQPATLFRDHAVLQRGLPVPVWGHATPGTEIKVAFAGQSKTATVDEFERWRVDLDPLANATAGQDLTISCSNGISRTVQDILVGDVWIMTGAQEMSSDLVKVKDGEAAPPALPLVREFLIKTKTRRFPTPRKMKMEVGGGKYVATWQPAAFDDKGDPPSVMAYHFARQVQQPGVPVGIVTLGAETPPLTWVSFASMQTAADFEAERDDLNLAYPNTDSCKRAITAYMDTVKAYNSKIAALLKAGDDIPAEMTDRVPAFPQPYYNEWSNYTETATHTYNFCISPITPCAVTGVVWLPLEKNLGEASRPRYNAALSVYAGSLPETYGQDKVKFIYAQPAGTLAADLGPNAVKNGTAVELSAWPKDFSDIADKLGAAAK